MLLSDVELPPRPQCAVLISDACSCLPSRLQAAIAMSVQMQACTFHAQQAADKVCSHLNKMPATCVALHIWHAYAWPACVAYTITWHTQFVS